MCECGLRPQTHHATQSEGFALRRFRTVFKSNLSGRLVMLGKIDLNDAVVSPFFVIASGVQAGVLDFQPLGIDFADPLVSTGSGEAAVAISIANLVAIAALAVAYATNRPELGDMAGAETWVAIVTVVLVVAPPLAPPLEALIQSSVIVGLVSVIIQAGGFYTLSYLG